MRPFVVNVADLVHKPAARRRERLRASLPGLKVGVAEVPADQELDIVTTLEWVTDGLLASGTIAAPWRAECTRCLGPARGHLDFEFRELFEKAPREGESYRLGHDTIDMEPLVREHVLLELPLVPLCAPDCQGLCATCGADLNQGPCGCDRTTVDPRWAALEGFLADPQID
ncbi:MAG: hypothetical protein QOH36_2217 [Actinomycetota bacterium]|jgi:uncharacterized protein|nr:hypothetical protein [Actinomycetota bacterium]MEA2974272.1 hypothetical protein [Actinomycetota bacterium]